MTAGPRQDYEDGFPAFYDKLFTAGETELAVAWLAAAHPGSGDPTLELGVGTGRIAIPLAERAGEVVGVDGSPSMLAVLRRRLEQRPAPVTPVHADIRTFAPERRYALVICLLGTLSTVLEPDDQRAVLRTCAGAVLAGGTVVIETHNAARILAAHAGAKQAAWTTPYPDHDAVLETTSSLDSSTQIWRLDHVWREPGACLQATETTRLTTAEEIEAYAMSAGLRPAGRLSGWGGGSFAGDEPMVICVLRAPPGSGRAR